MNSGNSHYVIFGVVDLYHVAALGVAMIEAGLVGWYLLACSAVPHRDAWTFVLGLCTLSSCHCCFPASAGTIIKHATHEVIVTGHFNFGAAHGMTCFEPCKLFNHHLHQGFCCFNITLCSVPVKPMPTARGTKVSRKNVQLYLCPISVMICPANQLQGVI